MIKSFVISLQDEKANQSIQYLSQMGFPQVSHFKGVNGKDLIPVISKEEVSLPNVAVSLQTMFDLENSRVQHHSIPSKGALGCYLSHVGLWKMLVESNLERIFIFEDDIQFKHKITYDDLEEMIQKHVPEDEDVFLFGFLNIRGDILKINDFVNKVDGQFWGLQSYMITKNGARKLLSNVFPIEMQIDSYIGSVAHVTGDINIYSFDTSLTRQKIHKSSIQDVCMSCDMNDIMTGNLRWRNIWYNKILLLVILFLVWKAYGYYKKK